MGELVDINSAKPNLTGDALCLCCGNKWVAVELIGAVEFECPECKTWKGVFVGMTAPKTVLECGCGCQHFYLGDYGPMCSRCGTVEEDY